MKHTASAKKTSKSNGSSVKAAAKPAPTAKPRSQFVVCITNGGYVDLEPLKVYKVRRDVKAAAEGLVRVIDASGEDYLYPRDFFRAVQVSQQLFELVDAATREATGSAAAGSTSRQKKKDRRPAMR